MRAAFVALLFCACGARPDLSAPASVSAVSPQKLVIVQGGAPVDIAIHVTNAFTDDVQVDIPSLPLELSATSVTIPAGVSDGTISIRATREAEQGPAGPIEVRAVTTHGEQRFPLDVFVRGCPGCLDNTYANNGVANLPHGVHLVAVDASDRVMVLSATSATSSIVSRVLDDGSPDPSFADVALPGNWVAMALDADGGAYVVGGDGQSTSTAVAAHVSSKGVLDMSFTLALGNTLFDSVAVASDGSVFAAGMMAPQDAVVVKLQPSGALDASFGNAGMKILVDGWGGTVACDGPLLLFTSGSTVRRFDANGALDTTFGNGGVMTSTRSLVQTFVIGDRYAIAEGGGVVEMLTRDGKLDPSFGKGGAAAANAGITNSASSARSIAFEPDGKLVVAGQVMFGEANEGTYVTRLNLDGTVDEAFATKGVILSESNAPAVALQSDGRIVVGGARWWFTDPAQATGFLARYWN